MVTLSPSAQEPPSADEVRLVDQLRARDTHVRAHEAAHVAASGGLGGTPSYDYETGPDGRRYAVGGEVSVDTSSGRTPEETLTKARTIRAAATAPSDPSAQDMAVAASASRMEADAQRALQDRRQLEVNGGARTGRPDGAAAAAARRNDGATPTAEPAAGSKDHEASMVLATLVREQIATRGGVGHSHLETGCGFCRKAVGAYS